MTATLHEHSLFAGSPVLGGVHRLTDGIDPHAHDFVEIAVVGTGAGTHLTSRGERPVGLGDVIVLRPGAWHGFGDCTDLTVANCCISAQALRAELAPLGDIPMFRRLIWTDPVAAGAYGVVVTRVDRRAATDAVEAVAALERELEGGRRTAGRVLGHLVTILGILADGRAGGGPAGDGTTPAPAMHPAVAATIARLEDAPERAWRLDELAAAVNLDAAYLGRLFRRHVGLTPLGLLSRIRAERAATLLTHSTLPAARVGAAVGWDDPTYFARRFRSLVGLSPTEYRRRS
ncbi:helix-turn-helix domain-containing protein [Jiangella rhizosphaerae]|uniref:AraC family transcriptional regulator n=1 Tax=Jiangella rhizosphaerae TaxID=2293569 RepID=A0A418KIU4_9ACTN|nr:AraC family transcriptional regulator [Jiangella rhizosphaerae]RIQ13674.1 AraC family transcriptional regulator [Jiangella rhizosphaerae]